MQTAILLTLRLGSRPAEVEALLTLLRESDLVEAIDRKEFKPEHGDVTIYQP